MEVIHILLIDIIQAHIPVVILAAVDMDIIQAFIHTHMEAIIPAAAAKAAIIPIMDIVIILLIKVGIAAVAVVAAAVVVIVKAMKTVNVKMKLTRTGKKWTKKRQLPGWKTI